MKTSLIVAVFIILITGIASSAMCQPELVYVENGIERKIEGIEKTKPYYTENGEKIFFDKGGELFLKIKDGDLLSWGYPNLYYIVKPDKEGQLKAITYIDDEAGKHVWEKIRNNALLKIWNDDSINNAKCFMAWYEPGSELIRVGNTRLFSYEKGKSFSEYFDVKVGSKQKGGFPVMFFWKDNMLIPPKPIGTDDEKIIQSLFSGDIKNIESADKSDHLVNIEDRLGNRLISLR